jgi:hypothetical protein
VRASHSLLYRFYQPFRSSFPREFITIGVLFFAQPATLSWRPWVETKYFPFENPQLGHRKKLSGLDPKSRKSGRAFRLLTQSRGLLKTSIAKNPSFLSNENQTVAVSVIQSLCEQLVMDYGTLSASELNHGPAWVVRVNDFLRSVRM